MPEQLALNNTGLNKLITERSIWYLTFRKWESEHLASTGVRWHIRSGVTLPGRGPHLKEKNDDNEKYSHSFSIFISAHMKKTELGTKIVHSVFFKKSKM